jgi:hypothetical protein
MFFQNDKSAGSSCLSVAGADAAGVEARVASVFPAFWATAVLAIGTAMKNTAAIIRGAWSDISRSLSCEIVRVSVNPENGRKILGRKPGLSGRAKRRILVVHA